MSENNAQDISILSEEQRLKLREFKIKTRIENEEYLRAHPEIELVIGDFLRDVLLKRPPNIHQFAANHFTNPNLRFVTCPTTHISSNTDEQSQ